MGQNLSHEQSFQQSSSLNHVCVLKGLSNETGHNNCFLNVILQSLYHLSSFRNLILSTTHIKHDADCVSCDLRDLFTYYEHGEDPYLSPYQMRIALENLGLKDSRFSLGAMGDATDALEAILTKLHHEYIGSSFSNPNDQICEPRCISHVVFECNRFDQHECEICAATSEPEVWYNYLFRVYVSELGHPKSLAHALQEIETSIPSRECPSLNGKCKGKSKLVRWILKLPLVFGVSLEWNKSEVTSGELDTILNIISLELDLKELMSLGAEASSSKDSTYLLRGLCCYYGKHYILFWNSMKNGKWILFDDIQVKIVGDWKNVKERIIKSCYLPTLIFWEKRDITCNLLQDVAKVQEASYSSLIH